MNTLLSSLRSRLILSYLALIIFGFGALSFIAGDEIETGLTEAYAGNLTTQSGLILRALQGQNLGNGANGAGSTDADGMLSIIQKLAKELDINITVLDHRGAAWLDSTYGTVRVNLSDEQEVKSAIGGKFVPELHDKDLMGEEIAYLYIAVPLTIDGTVEGYLRLGQPGVKLQDEIAERWQGLAIGVGLLGLLAIGLSIWNANALSQPLTRLRQTAKRLSDGDLSQRSSIDRTDEIGDLARTFNQMAASVESMLAEQRSFAANAAHELRTPLTTIRLRTEWLLSKELDSETEQTYLEQVDDEVRRLGRMVEDLQTLSQADANRLEAGQEQIDPERLAQALLHEFSEQAEARGVTVQLQATAGLPPVQANMNHLRLVFRNVLENAIKYTPDGGAVDWSLRPHLGNEGDHAERGSGMLISEVKDNGIGLDPADIPNLTKRFYRADKAHSRQVAGNGLGLSLVHSVVELYGGELQVESNGLGQGATVTILWPFL